MRARRLARLIMAAGEEGRQQRRFTDGQTHRLVMEQQQKRVVELEAADRAARSVIADAEEREQMALARVQELEAELKTLTGFREQFQAEVELGRKAASTLSQADAERMVLDNHALKTELRRLQELVTQMEADAELGRLVRALGVGELHSRHANEGHDGTLEWSASNSEMYYGGYRDTPEEALRAAGIGDTEG